MKKRGLAMLVALVLAVGSFPTIASASSGSQGIADAAASYLEKATGDTFGGGSDNWCGRFLYRCAEDAGEEAALCGSMDTMKSTNRAMAWFANNAAGVGYFYDQITLSNYGLNTSHKASKSDYAPQVGDIIFYDWDGDHNNLGHMEVATTVSGNQITTIGGSTGSSCPGWNGTLHVHKHTYDISHKYIVAYARPNYSNVSASATPTAPAKSELLLSPGTEPGEHREPGAPFYFRGVASSNYPIISSTVQVRLNDNMTVIMEKTITPNKNKIDVLADGLDTLKFGALDEGNYYFWWLVKDSSETLKSWTVHFSVGDPSTTPEPTPTPVSTPKPTATPTPSAQPSETVQPSAKPSEPAPSPVPSEEPSAPPATPSEFPEASKSIDPLPLPSTRSYVPDLFWDVKSNDWFYGNVADVYAMGLMNGTGAGSFSPGDNMTLAEAVTLAARIHSLYHTGVESFPRYDGGNWYDPYVDYARENNIINENYNYTRPATREEFVHILAKSLPEEELNSIAGAISFADSRDIVYRSDVGLLSSAGVINGIPENGQIYFKPSATITRAEVAAVVARMVQPSARLRT